MSVLFAEVFGPDAEEGEADEGNREDVEEPHDAERGPEVREEERDEQDALPRAASCQTAS